MRASCARATASRSARAGCSDDDERRAQGRRVRIVYPEIQGGRVIADVDVEGLGDYFVGERTRVYVTTGKRDDDHRAARGRLSPRRRRFRSLANRRRGRRADGRTRIATAIEILSGLHDGDVVVTP